MKYWDYKLKSDHSLSGNRGGNKLRTYRSLKQDFGIEKYLTHTDEVDHRKATSQLRLSSHPLNIESQRGTISDPLKRTCQVCDSGETENEQHFLMQCPLYNSLREEMLKELKTYPHVYRLNNSNKFIWILTSEDKNICKAVGKFIKKSFELRKQALG